MTDEDSNHYDIRINNLEEKIESLGNLIIESCQNDEIDKANMYDKKLKRVKKELADILSDLETDHFLEFGPGLTYDPEYV